MVCIVIDSASTLAVVSAEKSEGQSGEIVSHGVCLWETLAQGKISGGEERLSLLRVAALWNHCLML